MPKAAGSDMKTIRAVPKPAPARPLKRFESPAAPKVRPMSQGAPKIAANLKPEEKHPSGKVDPRQMHY